MMCCGSKSIRCIRLHRPRSGGMLLALALLLASCTPSTPPSSRSASATSSRSVSSPVTSTTAHGHGPTAVSSLLAPAPQHCPAPAPLQSQRPPKGFGGFTFRVKLIGRSPVWIPQSYFPTTLHVNQTGYHAYPGTKIVWEVGPNDSPIVKAQVVNLANGQLAWWDASTSVGGRPPSAAQTLVLRTDVLYYHGPVGAGSGQTYHEWGSYVYFTQAGCYKLTVTWPSGSWVTTFAVGR